MGPSLLQSSPANRKGMKKSNLELYKTDMVKPAREGQALLGGDQRGVGGGSRTWRPGDPSCLDEREGLDFNSVAQEVNGENLASRGQRGQA